MLARFHPLVATWFAERLGSPTAAQAGAWDAIARREDVLVAAPTGSGKTLAAFLHCIDELVRAALEGPLPAETRVLYISPLRALSNDVRTNLAGPLAEIRALADTRPALTGGRPLAEIRVAARTGDTPPAERARLARRPPHLYVTTPESLYILLTSERGRAALARVETVILDEIHALAPTVRGAHLALSLERLDALVVARDGPRPRRVGLSATQQPIEEVARFLVGAARVTDDGQPRCVIVETERRRALDLGVEVPRDELAAVPTQAVWADTYDRIAALVGAHRSTLVFVNTRRLVERAAHALGERLGEEAVAAHHGSLSKQLRHAAEQRLKAGQIRCVVATASLELGIDVGAVDLVCQVGAPRGLNVLVQRVGRSGHVIGGLPKGRLFPLTRDDLIECAAAARAVRQGRLDTLCIPRGGLDVLAQQLVAATAMEELGEDALYALVRRAWPYRDLARSEHDEVVRMLAEGVSARRPRHGALLHRDLVGETLRARRGARLLAVTSGGTIPDTALYDVVAEPDGTHVGTLDEDFAIESMAGDIFLLGNTSWRVRRVETGKVRVEDAHGQPPTIPFWFGEGPGRSAELSEAVGALRKELLEARTRDPAGLRPWLEREGALCPRGALQAIEYVVAGADALGGVPTRTCLFAERFFDEAGGTQLVIHAPLGARINRAFGMALRKRFCRSFDFELQAAATDDGLVLSLGPQHSFPLAAIFGFVTTRVVREALEQALLQAPVFPTRFRWTASRALTLPRQLGGKRVPPHLQRMRADDLLAAVFPAQVGCQDNHGGGPIELPDHPLVREAMRDCLETHCDLPGLFAVLAGMESGAIACEARETVEPSPFSHGILNANPYAFLDDAPLEERRTRAVSVRRTLPASEAALAALDAEAIAEVVRDASLDPRDVHELADLLSTLGVLPTRDLASNTEWADWLAALVAKGRATRLCATGLHAWVAAERLPLVRVAYPDATFEPPLEPPPRAGAAPSREDAVWMLVGARADQSPPFAATRLASELALPEAEVELALARLEAEGRLLRGRFTGAPGEEWCERRLLQRMQRATLGRLRQEIAPVAVSDYLRFLVHWQHVAPSAQRTGVAGVAEVVTQLAGLELPVAAWEREVLPARVRRYDGRWLDQLCLSGELVWGRLCPREGATSGPARSTPIALVPRTALPHLQHPREVPPTLSDGARAVHELLVVRGASFFADLALGHDPDAIEAALWELVALGLLSGDGWSGLRALAAPGPTGSRAPARREQLRRGTGRWALLPSELAAPPDALEARARALLGRWGVLFRDLLGRESDPPAWRDLLAVLRRLELRGEVRGGRFVDGPTGEQFALPGALEALRALRRGGAPPLAEILISATDPLNLVGILVPGPRIPRVLGTDLLLVDGVPVEVRAHGKREPLGTRPALRGFATPVEGRYTSQ